MNTAIIRQTKTSDPSTSGRSQKDNTIAHLSGCHDFFAGAHPISNPLDHVASVFHAATLCQLIPGLRLGKSRDNDVARNVANRRLEGKDSHGILL